MAMNKDKGEDDEFEIDFTNFLRIVVLYLKGNIEEDEHRNAFQVFDTNGSGSIEVEEIRFLLTKISPDPPDEKDIKAFIEYHESKVNRGLIEYEDVIK